MTVEELKISLHDKIEEITDLTLLKRIFFSLEHQSKINKKTPLTDEEIELKFNTLLVNQ
jgi:hypothetical protein